MKEKEAEREMNRTDAGEDTGMKDPKGKRKIQGVEEQPEELAAACLGYFRERPILGRLLEGFWEKYLSYGKFAGTVTVRILTESERMDLEGFLQRNYHGKKTASVSARRFEEALAGSRFAGIGGKEALELYFQRTPVDKKEQRWREEEQWASLLERIEKDVRRPEQERGKAEAGETEREQTGGRPALVWLSEIAGCGEEKGSCAAYLKKRWREAGKDFAEAERLLKLGIRILDGVPRTGKKEAFSGGKYLAVLAAELTGNPHAFDDGARDGTYLELLVKWYVREIAGEAEESEGEFPALERQKRYLRAGILRDDVSNYTLAAGILARNREGKPHRGMAGFLAEGEPVQIALSSVARWSFAKCLGNRLYIVENPSVYAILCGVWKRDCGLMCMNGQPRLSALLLLDLLAKAKTEVWYAGDFDPEGLLIAQKLKRYYSGSFHFWHMSSADYRASMSGEKITPRRLKILDGIADEELRETALAVKVAGRAGYQERLWAAYARDLAEAGRKQTRNYYEKEPDRNCIYS